SALRLLLPAPLGLLGPLPRLELGGLTGGLLGALAGLLLTGPALAQIRGGHGLADIGAGLLLVCAPLLVLLAPLATRLPARLPRRLGRRRVEPDGLVGAGHARRCGRSRRRHRRELLDRRHLLLCRSDLHGEG